MADIFLQALAAAAVVGMVTGLLSPFVLWERMVYLGDAMGHAALLGVVAGLALGVHPSYPVLAMAVCVGTLLFFARKNRHVPFDALLAMVSTGGLSLGLLGFSLTGFRQSDMYQFLFGDILSIGWGQVGYLFALAVALLVALMLTYRPLMRIVLHPEIAEVEGEKVARYQLGLMVGIAASVALSLQAVGMLLVTALLVVPAFAAWFVARSPVQLFVFSVANSVAAGIAGVWVSFYVDISTGPAIVVAALGVFTLNVLGGYIFRHFINM